MKMRKYHSDQILFVTWSSQSYPLCDDASQRGINISFICKTCCVLEEHSLHVLRDCEVARKFWFDIGTPDDINFHWVSLLIWLKSNCANKVDYFNDIQWWLVFSSTIWYTWKNGNSFIFNKKQILHTNIIELIFLYAKDVASILVRKIANLKRSLVDVRCLVSKIGWAKLKVDGSTKANPGSTNCASVSQNHLGGQLNWFLKKTGNNKQPGGGAMRDTKWPCFCPKHGD